MCIERKDGHYRFFSNEIDKQFVKLNTALRSKGGKQRHPIKLLEFCLFTLFFFVFNVRVEKY